MTVEHPAHMLGPNAIINRIKSRPATRLLRRVRDINDPITTREADFQAMCVEDGEPSDQLDRNLRPLSGILCRKYQFSMAAEIGIQVILLAD